MISQLDVGDARRVRLPVAGGRLAALQSGPDDGAAVLLAPGFTGSKEDFAPILRPLAHAGFRVMAVDQRGQYESPGWGDPAAYSLTALGADLAAAADQLGDRVHLLGHSFGGLVARAAVLAYPGRFASLVLVDSGPAGIDGGRRRRIELLRPVLAERGMLGIYEEMQRIAEREPGYTPPPPRLARFLRARFLASDPAGLLGMGDALVAEPDRVDELRRAGLPLLVITGVDDDAWPPETQAQMARRLGARHAVIADAAHSPAVENPAATAQALIEFWRSV